MAEEIKRQQGSEASDGSVRELTCIVCPRGCALTVTLSQTGEVLSVAGNSCPRGERYAQDECTHPRRTVTSTVRCEDGTVVPVKTSTTVPRELVMEVMARLNACVAPNSVRLGDVLIRDILGTGADVVATGHKPVC